MGNSRETVRQSVEGWRAGANCRGARGSSEGRQRGRELADRHRETEDRGRLRETETRHWTKARAAGPPGMTGHCPLRSGSPLGALGRLSSTALQAPQGPQPWPSPRSSPGEKYQPPPPESQTPCVRVKSSLLPIRGNNHQAPCDGSDSCCRVPGHGLISGSTVVFSK